MADITTTVDRERDLTVRTVTGEVTAEELLAAMAAYFPTGRYVAGRVGGRTALVFSSAFAYGMGREFDQPRNVSGSPVEYMSFLDLTSALARLGGECMVDT